MDEILQKIGENRGISRHASLRIQLSFSKKLHVRLTHELSMENVFDRISISESVMDHNEDDPF